MSGAVSGGRSTGGILYKKGSGTLTLGGNNTFASQLILNEGTLRVLGSSALGSSAATTRILGQTATPKLELTGGAFVGETLEVEARNGAALDAPAIINVSGTNTLGAVQGRSAGLGTDFNIESAGGTLTIQSGISAFVAGTRIKLSGAGNGAVGIVSGSAALVKTGSGTWTLNSANTYSGATIVVAGTLALGPNGRFSALGPSIDVQAGAVLDVSAVTGGATITQPLKGTGTIVGNVASTQLAPGASPGTLTFANDLSLAGVNTQLWWELNAADTTIGGGVNDLVAVGGNLTLDGRLDVAPTGSASFLNATGGTWTLLTYGGTLNDAGLTFGTMPALGSGYVWRLNSGTGTASAVTLSIVQAIPEPSSFAAALAMCGLALLRRRRKR
ncbi:MAG: autotransporter-associated beta strand repeat-containing protein [Pirellulales bacterium]